MTDPLEILRRSAIRYALKRGRSPEDAEDFAMYTVVRAITTGAEMNLKYCYLDFKKAKSETMGKRETDELIESAVEHEAPSALRFLDMISGLDSVSRCVVFLRIVHGVSIRHIGYCLGIHESRVSQIYGAALEQLRNRAEPNARPGERLIQSI